MVFLLIVFVVLAAGAGFLYFQWTNIQKLGSERVQKVLKEVEENEDIEDIEDIEDVEDVEDLEDIDLEELEEISPLVKRIVKIIPLGLISDYQETTNGGEDSSTEDEEETEEQKVEKTPGELLPDSIDTHPAMTLVDYEDLDEVPEYMYNQVNIEEDFINNQTIFLEFELDFPEREIEELKEMEEVPEDITDSMIEDEKDDLEYLYNTREVLSWYEEHLLENNWEAIKGKEIEGFNIMFQHERDGYFIILDLENQLYTPRNENN
ncbi:MAG: hypothetical protein R6V14_07675 [Halanaerobiales bacterium]